MSACMVTETLSTVRVWVKATLSMSTALPWSSQFSDAESVRNCRAAW